MSKELSNITESSFVNDIKQIVEQGRRASYGAVNAVMIETYWHIGKRIVEQEQNGKERAEYGKQLIEILSKELTIAYGKGFSKRNLQYFRSFYLTYSDIQIVQSRLHNLTWTHITHQDVGQMDMYVRMYDDLKRTDVDNPTVGIVLCSETSKDIARYSVLHDNKNLFAAKYMPLMPTEEELRREIEQQKILFQLQHNELNSTN